MYAETHSNIYQLVGGMPNNNNNFTFFFSPSQSLTLQSKEIPPVLFYSLISPIQQQQQGHLPVVITKVFLQITRRTLLTWIILVVPTIMRVIQLLGLTFSLVLGLFPINVICSLGLGETIDFAACETRKELFGELV